MISNFINFIGYLKRVKSYLSEKYHHSINLSSLFYAFALSLFETLHSINNLAVTWKTLLFPESLLYTNLGNNMAPISYISLLKKIMITLEKTLVSNEKTHHSYFIVHHCRYSSKKLKLKSLKND
jgi:hypothetical protein